MSILGYTTIAISETARDTMLVKLEKKCPLWRTLIIRLQSFGFFLSYRNAGDFVKIAQNYFIKYLKKLELQKKKFYTKLC